MRWPWQRVEKRESQPFTDAILSAISAGATGGSTASPAASAALEAGAGAIARGFASAAVLDAPDDVSDAVTPDVLAMIGRELIRRGESLHLIELDRDGAIRLRPCGSWDVRGGDDPESWFCRADLFGPSGNRTVFREHSSFLHCRYSADPGRPWFGLGPLAWASATGSLHAGVAAALQADMQALSATVVPVPPSETPDNADDDPLAPLKTALLNAKGKSMFAETMRSAHGADHRDAPAQDWIQRRLGSNPPEVLAGMLDSTALHVLAACGVDPVTVGLKTGDGTLAREAFRRFERLTLQPLARIVETELREKLDAPELVLNFDSLRASDFAGIARAYKGLVEAGISGDAASSLLDLDV